jgi:uncharacterized phage protein (TIGR02218 family)
MKQSAAATQNLLAGSQYRIADLYAFTLASNPGAPYYWTSLDAPVTAGGHTWSTGITWVRGTFMQERGVKVQTLDLEAYPQADNPGGAVTIAGLPFLQAVRRALFDSAAVQWYKLITSDFNAAVQPAPVPWSQFIVDTATAGRFGAKFGLSSNVTQLSTQMPRNLIQQSCTHSLFDTGCTLTKATFTVTGTVASNLSAATNNDITTNLTQADNWFSLGTITFTSGANAGVTRTVRRYLHTNGEVQFVNPPPAIIAPGDTFSIVAGCPKTTTGCANNNSSVGPQFNNLSHFRGMPFVPVPETLYAGGVGSTASLAPLGAQGQLIGGSILGALQVSVPYKAK